MTEPSSVHVPVLLEQVVRWLAPRPGMVLVDGTLGGGGHARALAVGVGQNGLVIGIDRDPAAIDAAEREPSRPAGAAGAGELLRPARGARTTGDPDGRRRRAGPGAFQRPVGRPKPGIQLLGRRPAGLAIRSAFGRTGAAADQPAERGTLDPTDLDATARSDTAGGSPRRSCGSGASSRSRRRPSWPS